MTDWFLNKVVPVLLILGVCGVVVGLIGIVIAIVGPDAPEGWETVPGARQTYYTTFDTELAHCVLVDHNGYGGPAVSCMPHQVEIGEALVIEP